MGRHQLRAAGGFIVLVVCLTFLPEPAQAQTGGGIGLNAGGILNDPFAFYYAFYLPNQQLQSLRSTPSDTINSAMVTRQYYAQTERRNLYNPISPYSDQNYDPLRPIHASKVRNDRPGLIGSAQSIQLRRRSRPVPLLRPCIPVFSWPS